MKVVIGFFLSLGLVSVACAQTATLKAKFVFDGLAPEPEKVINTDRDPYCATLDIKSEQLVVGEDGGIKNLAIWLDERRSDAEIPEEMKKPPEEKVELDNKGCRFEPHVIFAMPGQTIRVLNSDPTGHNANFQFFNNPPKNQSIPRGGFVDIELQADEPTAMPVECNIHPWMKGFVIVKEHPYCGITNEKGELTIENLPVGDVTFIIWHEAAGRGGIEEVTVDGEKQTWRRRRIELTLEPGVNDLGTVKIAPDQFDL